MPITDFSPRVLKGTPDGEMKVAIMVKITVKDGVATLSQGEWEYVIGPSFGGISFANRLADPEKRRLYEEQYPSDFIWPEA